MILALPIAAIALGGQCSAAYCRSRVGQPLPDGSDDLTEQCLYWNDTAIAFTQSSVGNPPTPDLGFPAVSKAWASWAAVAATCSSLQITESAHSSSRIIGYNTTGSNENLALFRRNACPADDPCHNTGDCNNKYDCWPYPGGTLALTTTTFDTNSGIIYDADIELNSLDAVFTDVDSPACFPSAQNQNCVATDIQETVTHETGHALGLEHNTSPTSTMFNSAQIGETSKRVIDPGSRQFVCDVYPDGGVPRDCITRPISGVLGPTAGCGGCGGTGGRALPLLALPLLALLARRPRRARG